MSIAPSPLSRPGHPRTGLPSRLRSLILLASFLALTACGGGGSSDNGSGGGAGTGTGTGTGNGSGTTPPATTGSIAGTVKRSSDDGPIPNATVSINGTALSATTDGNGNFTLVNAPPNDRAIVRVTATGFAETLKIVDVDANATASVSAQLRPVGATVNVAGNADLMVAVPDSPAMVSIPANSLVDASGAAYAGAVVASLTPVNPALDVNAMPGDYQAITAAGLSPMESWGAVLITLDDATGKRLNLAAGKTATIRIPVATRNPVIPATIPLFYFDETRGAWIEEGTATLAGTAPAQYYEGTVQHFSFWNADMIMDTVTVSGCVRTDAGAAAAGALVTSDGIDYSGSSRATSGADGTFQIPVRRASRAVLTGQMVTLLGNSASVGPFDGDTTLTDCLSLAPVQDAITIKLTWGAQPEDVDSHLFTPSGYHVYYGSEGSLGATPYANLDVDDVTSYGPEVITISRLMVGTYRYGVNNYSETYNPGLTGSPVRVELNQGGTVRTFSPPAGEATDGSTPFWTAFTLTVDAQCNVVVTPVNSWGAEPAGNAEVTPQYCTRP